MVTGEKFRPDAYAGPRWLAQLSRGRAESNAIVARRPGVRNDVKLAVVTRSEKGCVVVSRESNEIVKAAPIEKLVDATGAGDLFAAGFLVGLARDQDHRTAAQLGAVAAAEVIQHLGARPETSLKALAQQSGLPI